MTIFTITRDAFTTTVQADSAEGAILAMVQDAGYATIADAAAVLGESEQAFIDAQHVEEAAATVYEVSQDSARFGSFTWYETTDLAAALTYCDRCDADKTDNRAFFVGIKGGRTLYKANGAVPYARSHAEVIAVAEVA